MEAQPSREQLETMLRNADAAGDTQAVTVLVQTLASMNESPGMLTPQQPPQTGPQPTSGMLGQNPTDLPVVIGTRASGAPILQQQPSGMIAQNPTDIPVVMGQEESGAPILQQIDYGTPPHVRHYRSFQAEEAGMGQKLQLAAGFLLNANPEARKDMLRDVLGDDAVFETDERGRDIVTFGNERAYVNKPGWDSRDANQLAFDILKFLPAARLARWAGGVPGSLFRATRSALVGGPAAGVTQAGTDIVSGAFGSEQGVEPLGVALATAGGAGGEWIAGGLQRLAPLASSWPLLQRQTPYAQDVMDKIKGLRIDPSGSPRTQVNQISYTTRQMAAVERGGEMPALAAGVRTARQAERKAGQALYDAAEETTAAVPFANVLSLRDTVTRNLDSYGLADDGMNAVRNRLDELAEMTEGSISLQRLESWRKRVSGSNPRNGSPAAGAHKEAIRTYDEWLDGVFNDNMIQGDEAAIAAWKTARTAYKTFMRRFDSNKVIKDLARKETTQEQMAAWLFNSNAVGAKKEAGLVVQKLNNILGKDSAEMAGLRAEVILDIGDPLFGEIPDLNAFLKRYEQWFKVNKTLKRELFPGEYLTELEDLIKFARTTSRRAGTSVAAMTPTDIGGRIINLANRFFVGHGIARGQARLQSTGGAANFLRSLTSGAAARRSLIRDYLNMEPERLIIPNPTALGAAGFSQLIRE